MPFLGSIVEVIRSSEIKFGRGQKGKKRTTDGWIY